MIFLNEQNVFDVISLSELIGAVEDAYKIFNQKRFYMPDRIHVDSGMKNLLYMPCFKEGLFGTKILTVFPENAGKAPVIDGLMLLNDYETGKPKGLIDGKIVTALRTGAVGGVGIKYTTPDEVASVGMIGAGVQGFYQLLFACEVRNIECAYIYDLSFEKALEVKEKLEKALEGSEKYKGKKITIEAMKCSEELLEKSEVVITATTAGSPVLPNQWEKLKGKHFIGIGSYKENMREFPDELFKNISTILVDNEFAMEESGDLIHPLRDKIIEENQLRTFDDYILSQEDIKQYQNETTLFKSVGMALFDVVVSECIYNNAVEKGIGQKLIL